MNKTDLVSEVASKAGMTKRCGTGNQCFLRSSQDALKGDKVQLIGFGTFETGDRKARKGRNPQTGAEINIPASRVPLSRRVKP